MPLLTLGQAVGAHVRLIIVVRSRSHGNRAGHLSKSHTNASVWDCKLNGRLTSPGVSIKNFD